MSYIYGQPPPPPSHGYSQGGQQPYVHGGGGGGYAHPPHNPHQPHPTSQPQRPPASSSHRGGHQYSGGRPEYPPTATPTDYYQVHSYPPQTQPPTHPPAGGAYGQSWTTPEQYHQSPPHTHTPAAAAAAAPSPAYGAYPSAAYSQSQYPTGQQGYSHPPAPYAVHYQPSASTPSQWPAPAPTHSHPSQVQPPPHSHSQPQSSRSRGGYHGDRGSRASVPPPARTSYESSVPPPASNGYTPTYPPDPRATPYSSQPPYPYAPPPIHVTMPQRHESQFSGNNRRGRGGHRDHGSGGRGGKQHYNNNNSERGKFQHKSGPATQPAASGTPNSDASLANKKKKRKMDQFGLKGTGDVSGDEDDDEARLPHTLGNDGIPSLPEDLTEWLANRRKNFPTRARIAQKEAEEDERKAAEEAAQAKKTEEEAATLALEKQASALRKQLKRVESSIKRKREQHDDGDELRESPSESDSDDGPPEALSTRAQPSAQDDAAKKADVNQPCKYYSTGATCGKGSKCRFVHDQAEREEALREKAANGDKHTIRQRLVLNDQNQEDYDILQCIVYLRDKGVEGSESRIKTLVKNVKQEQSLSKLKPVSTLPARPPTLPENPLKKEASKRFTKEGGSKLHHPATKLVPQPDQGSLGHYHGWNLRPYGGGNDINGGPKSDDLP